MARRKVPVSRRALIQRVTRALAKEGKRFRTNRAWRTAADQLNCRYYTVNESNYIAGGTDDLEELARDLEVLAEYEVLAGDE